MSYARLLAVEVERFKSFKAKSCLELAPITVQLGRNNSGKSSLIQPLLLLKQTLAVARPELVLDLSGELISARSIRDLTHDWPDTAEEVMGRLSSSNGRAASTWNRSGSAGSTHRAPQSPSELVSHGSQRSNSIRPDPPGVDQLNIVEYGAPATEGRVGHLHHVPSKKEGKVHDVGWSCP